MVPLVESAGLVDAFVALQPNQPGIGGLRDRPGEFGLTDPAGPSTNTKRLTQPVGRKTAVAVAVSARYPVAASRRLTSSMSANIGASAGSQSR